MYHDFQKSELQQDIQELVDCLLEYNPNGPSLHQVLKPFLQERNLIKCNDPISVVVYNAQFCSPWLTTVFCFFFQNKVTLSTIKPSKIIQQEWIKSF